MFRTASRPPAPAPAPAPAPWSGLESLEPRVLLSASPLLSEVQPLADGWVWGRESVVDVSLTAIGSGPGDAPSVFPVRLSPDAVVDANDPIVGRFVVRTPEPGLTARARGVRVFAESTPPAAFAGRPEVWLGVTGDGVTTRPARLGVTRTPPLPTPLSPTPGTAVSIEAEAFDAGGQGLAYSDTDAANRGGAFRTDEGVDVERGVGTTGAGNVGWIEDGEWLEYTVDAADGGHWFVDARVASPHAGGSFELQVGGERRASFGVPATGGWQRWETRREVVRLDPGVQTLRVRVGKGGFNLDRLTLTRVGESVYQGPTDLRLGDNDGSLRPTLSWQPVAGADAYTVSVRIVNEEVFSRTFPPETSLRLPEGVLTARTGYNWSVTAAVGGHVLRSAEIGRFDTPAAADPPPAAGQRPFSPSGPVALPTRVGASATLEAEDFDLGGPGVAYADHDAANRGGAFRTDEAVDVERGAGTSGRGNVGWIQAGEWMEYAVTVPEGGLFEATARVASPRGGGAFTLTADGTLLAGFSVGATGGWQSWRDEKASGIRLSAGTHVLRVRADAAGFNLDRLTFTRVPEPDAPVPGPWGPDAPRRLAGAGFEAESFDASSPGGRDTGGVDRASGHVGYFDAGDWIRFDRVGFSPGLRTLEARVASPWGRAGRGFELRLGSPTGERIASFEPRTSSGWNGYERVATALLRPVSGTHDLYVVGRGGTALGNLDHLRFV